MRRLVPVFALLLPWLLFEPLLHAMRFEKGVVSIAVALVCLFVAPLAIGMPTMRPILAAAGFALVASNFVFPDNAATMTSHVVAGLILIVAGANRATASSYSDAEEPRTVVVTPRLRDQPGTA